MLKQITLSFLSVDKEGKSSSNTDNETEKTDEGSSESEISEDENSDESYETPLQVEEQREEVSNNQGSNESNNFAFPSCWNQIIWVKKKKQYSWLTCKNSKLGCTVCRDLPSLGIHSKKGIHLSQEWQLSEITASGHTKEKQLTSLQNKSIKSLRHI